MINNPIFYSQNFEDVLLARCFSGKERGFYIDVGAADEEIESVTKYFYESGWSGINVEPVSEFAETFRCRNRDVTVCCAAGSKEGFTLMAVSLTSGLSTFNKTNAANASAIGQIKERREVRVTRLDQILADLGHHELDFEFLKIDVEGYELQVLEGIDLNRYHPQVILCEVTLPNTSIRTDDYVDICNRIEAFDYSPVYFDGLNQWWCAREKESELRVHFRVPPGVFDSTLITPYSSYCARRELERTRQDLGQAAIDLEVLRKKNSEYMESLEDALKQLSEAHESHSITLTRLARTSEELAECIRQLDAVKASWTWRAIQAIFIFAQPFKKKEVNG
jgi:FkbM family methyltransferase